VGASSRFYGAMWMHGYPAVRGYEVDVMSISCRQLLKYIIYEILCRKGRKASTVGSFAIFAPFAVNQIMKLSPRSLFGSPAAPFSPSRCPGAPYDLLHPPLWCGGWQALFDLTGNLLIEFETL